MLAHAQNHDVHPCPLLKLALNRILTYKDVIFANNYIRSEGS